ncbi:MAG: hypothetical protein QOH56_729 [Pseudonocardiales bacterium]|nr:hypothetical protein [Pseudonocardiales bacterium]
MPTVGRDRLVGGSRRQRDWVTVTQPPVGRSGILEGQPEHRSLLSLGIGYELLESGDDEIESLSDVVGGYAVGQQRARRCLGVSLGYQRNAN